MLFILFVTFVFTPSASSYAQQFECEHTQWDDPKYGAQVRELASNGSKEHQYILGLRCEKSDTTRARYWYSEAVEPDLLKFGSSYPEGHALAQYRLALIEIEAQNYETAVSLLKESSSQGFAASQNLLGKLFQKGNGVKKSYGEAYKLYLSSARLGCADAQANLSWLLQLGKGTNQDFMQALAWANVAMKSDTVLREPPKDFKQVIFRIDFLKKNLSPDELSQTNKIESEYYHAYVESAPEPICPTF